MNISNLIPKNAIRRINITDKIPVHSTKMLSNEVASLRYITEQLFDVIKIPKSQIPTETLEKFGIKKFSQNITDGIEIFGKECDYRVQIPDRNTIKIALTDKQSGRTKNAFIIQNNNITEEATLKNLSKDSDTVIEEALDEISSKLIKFKSMMVSKFRNTYIPTAAETKKINEINKTISTPKIRNTAKIVNSHNMLTPEETKLCNEILENYNNVKEVFQKFNNPITRSNVKSYYKNYDLTKSNATATAFTLGKGKSLSVTVSAVKGKTYLTIKSTSKNQDILFSISEDGTIQKNMPYQLETLSTGIKKRKLTQPEYYTKEEIEALKLGKYLELANTELKRLAKHGENWLNKQNKFAAEHTNTKVGTTAIFSAQIENIQKQTEKFKKLLAEKHPHGHGIEKLKEKYNIEWSKTGIKINDALKGKDFRLTFPILQGKQATQLLVMKGENIEKSFYILDERLVKFEIKKVSDKITHPNRQLYYHTQEYIDKSELGKYLKIVQSRLNEIIENI
jgi:ribosomal protein S13